MLLPASQHGGPAAFTWPAALFVWGPGSWSDRHRHHCVQLVFALRGTLRFREREHQPWTTCGAVLVTPDAWHEVDARDTEVLIAFVDAESELAAALLERADAAVAPLAPGMVTRACSARHRGAMESRTAPPAMDAALVADSCGPPKDRRRHSHPGEQDGRRESALGSTSDPWRVGQSRRRGVGANRLTAPAATAASAVTDVAHLSDESRRHAGLDRFLHRTDRHRPSPVRPRRADASPPADRSRRRHRASDGDLDGAADD
jgi:hypothetical protein